jgi:predicted phage-related endonuclease
MVYTQEWICFPAAWHGMAFIKEMITSYEDLIDLIFKLYNQYKDISNHEASVNPSSINLILSTILHPELYLSSWGIKYSTLQYKPNQTQPHHP